MPTRSPKTFGMGSALLLAQDGAEDFQNWSRQVLEGSEADIIARLDDVDVLDDGVTIAYIAIKYLEDFVLEANTRIKELRESSSHRPES